jgi:hypothetical protein
MKKFFGLLEEAWGLRGIDGNIPTHSFIHSL